MKDHDLKYRKKGLYHWEYHFKKAKCSEIMICIVFLLHNLQRKNIIQNRPTILDAGAGEGMTSLYLGLALPQFTVIGAEKSSTASQAAQDTLRSFQRLIGGRAYQNVRFLQADLEHDALPDCDVCLCREVIEHLEHPENFLQKLASCEVCLVTTPDGGKDRPDKYDHRLYDFPELVSLLKGFFPYVLKIEGTSNEGLVVVGSKHDVRQCFDSQWSIVGT